MRSLKFNPCIKCGQILGRAYITGVAGLENHLLTLVCPVCKWPTAISTLDSRYQPDGRILLDAPDLQESFTILSGILAESGHTVSNRIACAIDGILGAQQIPTEDFLRLTIFGEPDL